MGPGSSTLHFLAIRRESSSEQELARYRFERRLSQNYKVLRREYWRKNPGVINTDAAKELCPEYAENRTEYSKCVYQPAKRFADQIFLEEMESGRHTQVTFLAGG